MSTQSIPTSSSRSEEQLVITTQIARTSVVVVNILARRVAVIAGLMLTLVVSSEAQASGIARHGVAGHMYRQVFQMVPGATYTFTTRNLSTNSDTIIDILRYPDGQFIAGND